MYGFQFESCFVRGGMRSCLKGHSGGKCIRAIRDADWWIVVITMECVGWCISHRQMVVTIQRVIKQ